MTDITRRNLAKGAAWSIPAVTIAASAPAMAASCSAATAPTVMKKAEIKLERTNAGGETTPGTYTAASSGEVAVPQEAQLTAYAVFQTTDLDLQPSSAYAVTSTNNGVQIKDIKTSQSGVETYDNDGNPVTDADGNPVLSKTEKRVRTSITIALTKPLDVGDVITIVEPTYTANGYYQEYNVNAPAVSDVSTFDSQACQNVIVSMDSTASSGAVG